MASRLIELFEDELLREKVKNKLPYLFHIAELESSRANKIGMEVGSTREDIEQGIEKGNKFVWNLKDGEITIQVVKA